MQITHEEAQRLIQFSQDQELRSQERNTLQEHLEGCTDCRSFAEDIRELRGLLGPTMRKHWNLQPIPLSVEALKSKSKFQLGIDNLLVTRTAIIGIIFASFIFSTWQFAHSGNRMATPMPLNVLPAATPSGETTSTLISAQNCVEMKYRVQAADTLESIASKFSASKAEIMAINHLRTESIGARLELIVPVCVPTSTSTVFPSAQTTTFTPVIGSRTSAPGG